jgi:peptide/nickel transport system substrate-binding protein
LMLKDLPVLKENETKGNYKIRFWKQGNCNAGGGIIVYFSTVDKGLGELLMDKRLRQAMQWAINKERINDVVYLGLQRPRAHAMVPEGVEYQSSRGQQVLKDWENQCLAYEPDTAKKLLDDMGLKDVNGDGFRERPDGSPLEFLLDCSISNTDWVEAHQLVKQDWEAVGLKMVLNVIDGTVVGQRAQTSEAFGQAYGGAASGLVTAPAYWTPIEDTGYCVCGQPYGAWYQSGGQKGLQPPAGSFIEKLQQVYDDAIKIVDDLQRNERVLDGYQIHIDEGPILIGTVGDALQPILVKNNVYNVGDVGLTASSTYCAPGSSDPEHWWKG